jgi:hypothetical protein
MDLAVELSGEENRTATLIIDCAYRIKKGPRGRFGVYLPTVKE